MMQQTTAIVSTKDFYDPFPEGAYLSQDCNGDGFASMFFCGGMYANEAIVIDSITGVSRIFANATAQARLRGIESVYSFTVFTNHDKAGIVCCYETHKMAEIDRRNLLCRIDHWRLNSIGVK